MVWVFVLILISVVVTLGALAVSGYSLREGWINIALGMTVVIVAVVALAYFGREALREPPRDTGSVTNAPSP